MEDEKVTFSVPDDEKELIEQIDAIVEDYGRFDDRTEAIQAAIGHLTGVYPDKISKERYQLYDAAVTSYVEAKERGHNYIEENARDHILNQFPETKMAKLLESQD